MSEIVVTVGYSTLLIKQFGNYICSFFYCTSVFLCFYVFLITIAVSYDEIKYIYQDSSLYLDSFMTDPPMLVFVSTILTLYGHIKTAEQRTIIQQYGDWYDGR